MVTEMGREIFDGSFIKQHLRRFAESDASIQAQMLPWMIHFVAPQVNTTNIGRLIEPIEGFGLEDKLSIRERFAVAGEKAIKTGFIVHDPTNPVFPWAGGYTAVLQEQNGDIVGAISHPQRAGYFYDGTHNLFAASLAKNQISIYLNTYNKEHPHENLILDSNAAFYHLENSVGLKRKEDLFLGEARAYINERPYFVAVSGCELNQDFVDDIRSESEKGSHFPDKYTGRAEHVLARIIANHLSRGYFLPNIPEPSFFDEARRSH